MEHNIPNREDLESVSIQDLAVTIFNDAPKPSNSQQILIQQVIEDGVTPVIDIFEVFLTILVEGIMIVYREPSWDLIKTFNEDHILNLRPWTHSLGFNVKVQKICYEDKYLYDEYYCKTILRCDPEWNVYFRMKNIQPLYTFIFGANSPYKKGQVIDNLQSLYAIFICGAYVYKISFEYHR